MLSVESFSGTIWEPACGEGAISEVLLSAGYKVVSTDLVARGYGSGGIDFLAERQARARHIVTNPPYGRGLGDALGSARRSRLPPTAWASERKA